MTAKTGEWLHAAFVSPADARDALDQLARDGVPAEDIEVRSSAPLGDESLPVGAKLVTRVPWMAATGGLFGGTAFFLLVKLTSQAYPLPTGGMPIVPLPPAGVIAFEGVAIGALLFTVATVLYECGLPSLKRRGPLDHHIAVDGILVSVRCDQEASTSWTARAMETARG